MKIKSVLKKSNAKAASGKKSATKITKDVADLHCLIVMNRAPKAKVLDQIRGRALNGSFTKSAFLVTNGGTKKGLYVSPIMWDGKDLYYRVENDGRKSYGSFKALAELEAPGFTAAIVNGKELAEMARAQAKVLTVKHVSTDKDVTVALLNSFGNRFVGGVTKDDKGRLTAITMEHPDAHNARDVQFVKPREVNTAKRFLASLVS